MHGKKNYYRVALLVIAGCAGVAWASACGDGAVELVPPEPARPASITVEPSSATLTWLGEKVVFRAIVKDQYGAVFPATVTWSSSSEAVFTIDGSGTATAVTNGSGMVTAAFEGLNAAATVQVAQAPESLVRVSGDGQTGDLGAALAEPVVVRADDKGGSLVVGATVVFTPGVGHGTTDPAEAVTDSAGLARTVWTLGEAVGDQMLRAEAGDASVELVAHTINPDRAALITLYEATDGPNWFNGVGWLSDEPLGNWYGVNTDDGDRVVGLDLSSNGLNGEIPTALWNLTKLQFLDLSGSPLLRGRIPSEVGNLTDLTRLSIWSNQVTGEIPPELGNLTRLTTLILTGNELTGPIPPEIGNLTNLDTLMLGGPLTGVIPPEVGQLTGLTRLFLGGNFTGPIPPGLGRLKNLKNLQLSGSDLSGPIPPELGDLANLTELRLYYSALTGRIPKELGNLSRLKKLLLNDNGLTGPVPPELANLSQLESLHLDQNQLTGPLPVELSNLTQLKGLFFFGNAGLCVPGTRAFVDWLEGIASQAPYCNQADADALNRVYQGTGGPDWTNSTGWLTTPALDEWYGVSVDSLGRVVTLDLTGNGLTGPFPTAMGSLAEITRLRIGDNALTGRLPLSLAHLALRELDYADTGLCAPTDEAFRAWLNTIPSHRGTGECSPLADRDILAMLYEATNGPNWAYSGNWLTDAPLGDWYGVFTDGSDRIASLELNNNRLTGEIPNELGDLVHLARLELDGNQLTGPIPAELGSLSRLTSLRLGGNALTGPIPAALGNLSGLQWLDLSRNWLTGGIPRELGSLTSLGILNLQNNGLSGEIPVELGSLSGLVRLWLSWNRALHGPLPESLTALDSLERFRADGTGLCAPITPGFEAWLETIYDHRIQRCRPPTAFLTQAVQSRKTPVPLVAGRKALLRAFVTTRTGTSARVPPIRARFYRDGREIHVENIPGTSEVIPARVDETVLTKSSNAEIPGSVVQPGLDMLIEVDPQRTLDPATGLVKRIPETGRLPVDVRALPPLDLTLVPLVLNDTESSHAQSVVNLVNAMATDPETNEELWQMRTLLPVGEMDVVAHDVVAVTEVTGRRVHSSANFYSAVQLVRALEGGTGHYMGVTGEGTGGLAEVGGWVSWAGLKSAAHELGHNMSLRHAPYVLGAPYGFCGATENVDPHYPYRDGTIGAWGYDFEQRALVPPDLPDVMSYCDDVWIGDYHFAKALRYRLETEGEAAVHSPRPVRSLLLWGGTDSDGRPFLEPAFIVDAPPALPKSAGRYEVTGQSVAGTQIFSLSFAMPEVADADAGSGFVFALPIRTGWEGNLAHITLSGPGGSFTLDGNSDLPMAILRDPRSGQVRGILSGPPDAALAQADMLGITLRGRGFEVLFSRGIPTAEAWRR